MSVSLREFDGARSIEVTASEGMVYIEVGGHCYAYDKILLLHQVRKELGIAFVVQEEDLVALVAS